MTRVYTLLLAGIMAGLASGVLVWFALTEFGLLTGPLAFRVGRAGTTSESGFAGSLFGFPPPVMEATFEESAPAVEEKSAPLRRRLPARRDLDPVYRPIKYRRSQQWDVRRSVARRQALRYAEYETFLSTWGLGVLVRRRGNDQPNFGLVDDALSLALEAISRYTEEGFQLQKDEFSGRLGERKNHVIVHELAGGLEYWFVAATDVEGAEIDLHVFDQYGDFAEAEHWQEPGLAAVRTTAEVTGPYFLFVEIGSLQFATPTPDDLVPWGLVSAFR